MNRHLTVMLTLALAFVSRGAAQTNAPASAAGWAKMPVLQEALGVTNFTWDGDSVGLSNDNHHVRFFAGRRRAEVNGTAVWLNVTPCGSVSSGDWRVASADLDLLRLAVLPRREGDLRPMRVLLDPGHGGEDNGAVIAEPAIREKELTLALARRIGACLTNAGLEVAYTRTNDVTLSLSDRSRLARERQADVFVSVHANYATNGAASGVETFILPACGFAGTHDGSPARGWLPANRNDYHNTLLGYSVHSRLAELGETLDRGLKRQGFFVLRETPCPAVLVEFGFLSNSEERARMRGEAWQQDCASAIAEGIRTYARKVHDLEQAVADKRTRDAEADARWLQHLAGLQTTSQTVAQAVAPPVPAPLTELPDGAAPQPLQPELTSPEPKE